MVTSCISDFEKNLLKSLIGKRLNFFKSEAKDSWNRIFGNISIVTDDKEIEIRNELTETEYFGDTEDVSKFKIKEISSAYPFVLMVESPVVETKVDEVIEGITIIQDNVNIKNSENESVYEITFDSAIVIKTDKSTFAISRQWHLEEELSFVKTADYKSSVYSIENTIADWADEDEKMSATCNRSEYTL